MIQAINYPTTEFKSLEIHENQLERTLKNSKDLDLIIQLIYQSASLAAQEGKKLENNFAKIAEDASKDLNTKNIATYKSNIQRFGSLIEAAAYIAVGFYAKTQAQSQVPQGATSLNRAYHSKLEGDRTGYAADERHQNELAQRNRSAASENNQKFSQAIRNAEEVNQMKYRIIQAITAG